MTQEETAPKLFISCSWISPRHKLRVLDLAQKLRTSGVDPILDKWELKEGQDTIAFMERMVTDPTIDKILMVVDKDYTEKANAREGGIGTEAQIISKEIYDNKGQEKFVALVLEKDANGKPYLPLYYQSRIYIDFSESHSEKEFEKLLRWIFDKPLYVKPDDGLSEDDEERQINIEALVFWFKENYQDLDEGGLYHESKEGGYHGDICDASEELHKNFPNEDYDIIEAAVEEIEASGNTQWTPIYDDKESLIGDSLEDIDDKLSTLIDNAPKPKTAPAFALGDDNRFHITLPPDSQPVDSRDVSLKELRETIEALLKSRIWANTHPELTPIVEEYKEVISGEQVSISEVYWSGIKFDNAVEMIKETLPFNAKVDIKTAIDKHGAYIVLDEEGRRLVEASVVYRQSAEQAEVLKTAGEQLAKNVAENPDLFGKDVRDNFSDFSNDIGKGKYPERSNQSNVNKITNLFSSILRWMKSPKGTITSVILGGSVVTSTPGQMAIKAGASLIDKAWVFLINTASSIKAFATQSPWLAEAVQILERIASVIG